MRGFGRPLMVALGMVVSLAVPRGALMGQEGALADRCARETVGADVTATLFCGLVAQSIESVQAPLGLAVTGGNPVPGTASTLGMRIGRLPRVSVGGRLTGVWLDQPNILNVNRLGERDFSLTSLNADAAVGLFQGFSPAPTVGGVLSIDLLGSMGMLFLPEDEGFGDGSSFTWALGARLGVLRESFTLPGASVSVMYRRVGDVTYGDPLLSSTDAFYDLSLSIWSLRAAVSKRLFALGATAGVGYDRYSSDVRFGFVNPGTTGPEAFRIGFNGFDNDRFLVFGNLSWTLLILHIVGELGWQEGADRVPGVLPTGIGIDADDGRFFGSLAIRLSI